MQCIVRMVVMTIVGLSLPLAVSAEEDLKGLVATSLILSHDEAAAGSRVSVGVLYVMKPHWHIYWRYPGDAGLPTQMQLEESVLLPASDLHWPVPRTFKQPGDILGYGYEGSVLLWREFDIPNDVEPGKKLSVTVATSWLACADLCVPDKARLQGEIKIGKDVESADRRIFDSWRTRLPEPIAVGDSKAAIHVQSEGGLDPAMHRGRFELALTPLSGKLVEVVIGRERVLKLSGYNSSAHGDALEVRFEAEVTQGKALQSKRLPILMRVQDGEGTLRSYETLLPVYAE